MKTVILWIAIGLFATLGLGCRSMKAKRGGCNQCTDGGGLVAHNPGVGPNDGAHDTDDSVGGRAPVPPGGRTIEGEVEDMPPVPNV
ncbi:MAG: hypothetical protein HYR96_16180 [Deltaproteobacteria bacterium]|nr:hypothetical protein [Deltaproteobacteria bacterium]MBI3295726.1 hypothetical protein [Deltaproteobacteria bacterium]